MLTVLPSAPDVLALSLDGRLDHDSAVRIIELTEHALAKDGDTHMFVEVANFSGLDMDKLPQYLARALPMLRHLRKFGRIAVVSDQSWVRAWAKIESALLPYVSYETFPSSERDQALAWVEGRSPLPHGSSFAIIQTSKPDVIGFEIDGPLERAEVEAAAAYFEESMLPFSSVRVFGRIRRLSASRLAGFFDADFIRMKLKALAKVERYAIVGGPSWMRGWISMLDQLAKADIRHFGADQEALAWEWLEAEPKGKRALAAG